MNDPKSVLLVTSLVLFFGCSSPKPPKESNSETPPPVDRELRIKSGAIEMKLSDDEKIRAKPKGGGAFLELVIDY